jgi:hypothetical protein
MPDNDRATTTVDRAILEEALKSLQQLIHDVDPDSTAATDSAPDVSGPTPPATASTRAAPTPRAEQPEKPENEDLPVLTEVIEVAGAGQPASDATVPELILPSARGQMDPDMVPELTDSAIRVIDSGLRERAGRPMDPATRLKLRRQIYFALQEWLAGAAMPDRRPGDQK